MNKENNMSNLEGCVVSTDGNTGSIKFNPTTTDGTLYTQHTFGGSGIDNFYRPLDRPLDTSMTEKSSQTKISVIDDNDNIHMGKDNIHIQPVNNGFVLTVSTCDNIETHVFTTFKDLLVFLDDNPIMDVDASLVAEHI